MIFSIGELTGLAAICGDGRLPEIPIPVMGREDAVIAKQGLRAKGVLGDDGKITAFGKVPIRVIEQYQQSARHVSFNHMRTSLNDDGALTVLIPAGDKWNLFRVNPVAWMVALIKAFPFLSGGGDAPDGIWQPHTWAQWAAAQENQKQILLVRQTTATQPEGSTMAFSVDGPNGFAFDMDKLMGRELPVWQIRRWIASLIDCRFDETPGGGR